MTITEKIRAELVIQRVAFQANKTPADVRRDMQSAIDEAWQTMDPATMEAQRRRFPFGKPTVEEFMLTLSEQIN